MLLDHESRMLATLMQRAVAQKKQRFAHLAAALDAMSPLKVLGRGYSLERTEDGSVVQRAEQLRVGETLEITLRKGTAAAHYVLGGPQGNDTNAFSIGTATTEIYVMHGETAAAAMYARRLVKDEKAGKDLQPTIDKMNELIQDYAKKSSPKFCAKAGLTDEIVDMNDMRPYIQAIANACYQNPESICPFHQMLLPRVIRDYDNLNQKA